MDPACRGLFSCTGFFSRSKQPDAVATYCKDASGTGQKAQKCYCKHPRVKSLHSTCSSKHTARQCCDHVARVCSRHRTRAAGSQGRGLRSGRRGRVRERPKRVRLGCAAAQLAQSVRAGPGVRPPRPGAQAAAAHAPPARRHAAAPATAHSSLRPRPPGARRAARRAARPRRPQSMTRPARGAAACRPAAAARSAASSRRARSRHPAPGALPHRCAGHRRPAVRPQRASAWLCRCVRAGGRPARRPDAAQDACMARSPVCGPLARSPVCCLTAVCHALRVYSLRPAISWFVQTRPVRPRGATQHRAAPASPG